MKLNTCYTLLLLTSAVTLHTSCQDQEFGYTKEDVQNGLYARKFADSFGAVDPNHTWSTADQLKLNVDINYEGEYTVKVYTANPRYPENNAYLVGEYRELGTGHHSLLCDMPATIACAYVGLVDSQGNRMILPAEIAEHTASVAFGTEGDTRAVYSGSTPFGYGASTQKVVSNYDDIRIPLQTLPEHANNTGKVTQNFEYISMGDFDIYPIYSITSNSGGRYKTASQSEKDAVFGERLGIYTYDNWGKIQKDDNGEIKVTWIWHMNRGVLSADNTSVVSGSWFEGHKSGESDQNWHQMYWFENNISGTEAEKAAREQFCAWKGSNFANGYDKIRTDGIHLNINSGLRFGFVLDTDHGYVYSNSAYNLDEGGTGNTTPDHIKDTYAATFHANNALYLAFEDWCYSSGGHDNDFNDLVLKLVPSADSNNPLIIDKDSEVEPIIYIVACEDLGGTFDWDFNDVVFGIEHISGHTQARVKLMAAGGTLPISLQYCPTESTTTDITFADLLANSGTTTSLHAAMGTDDETPVNVISDGYQHSAVYSNYFDVDRYDFTVLDDANKFKIKVIYKDGTSERDIQMPDKSGTVKVPQAFLIADPNWQWPSEGQNIVSKYSDFQNWVTNSLAGNNWTHTVWGVVREYNTIPSNSTSLLNFSGAVTYEGNKAIITLDKNYMTANSSYKLAIMISEDADAVFQLKQNGSYVKIDAAPNGSVLGDHLTTFSLSADVINSIRNSGENGKLTLTFANGIDASKCVKLVNWYKDGEKLPSGIEVASSFDLYVGETLSIPYTTQNQESPVVITSDDNTVVGVNDDGTIIARAVANGITIRLTQESSEHYAREVKTVTVNVLSYYATVDLPSDHFHTWSGAGKNGVILNTEDGALTLNTATTLLYGNGNVNYLKYIDLSGSDVLVATVSSGEPRFLFNRTTNGGTVSVELPRDKSLGYESVIDNGDGTKKYVVNLKKIREKDGFVHLHAIKGVSGGNVTASSVKLDKYSCTNHWETTGNLTDYGYNKYTAGTYNTASPTADTYEAPTKDDNVIYGDNGPSAYTFKIMDSYKVLKITYTGAEPRFFFNRPYVYDNDKHYETGTAIDIAEYKTSGTDSDGNKVIYINLAAIKRDKGYVHLNGIKKAWDGTTSIVGNMNILY